MTKQPSLAAIDFSKPDGEFVLRDELYQVKQYLGRYFFKSKQNKHTTYIYSFRSVRQAEKVCKQQQLPSYFGILGRVEDCIERCV